MPASVLHERNNIYRVELSGTLRMAEFARCQTQLAGEIQRIGPVRLLFVLHAFSGWAADGNWSDLSFYISHGDRIERIAIVGPERWRDETMMFAAADLRLAPVEFFLDDALDAARAWLSS
jgi:SpoIIAA-like